MRPAVGEEVMSKSAKQTLVAIVAVVAGVLAVAGLGLYGFFSAMWTPLHQDPGAVPSAAGVAPAPAWATAADRSRRAAMAGLTQNSLPGLSVAVGVDGELVWSESFGWADLDKRVPVNPRTRFRIGHVSKTLTSAAVGLLVEQDRLDLDAEIQRYVPAFPRKEWPVTLRQLMGHTAGIRHYDSDDDFMPSAHCERASNGLGSFVDAPLLFEPGTRSRYSSFAWILVSAAVEAVADEPFFTFMRRRIFEPLGMAATTVDGTKEAIPDSVTFYYPRFSGDPGSGPEPARAADYSCFAGAGAFLSTPSDLVRFGLALGDGTLLKRHTVTRLQLPQLLTAGEETQFGLGWALNTVPLAGEPTREAGHASLTLLGGSTSFLTFPERGIVVAVTSNISRANTRSIALSIADAFAGRGDEAAGNDADRR